MASAHTTHTVLALYRDPRIIGGVARRKFCPNPASMVLELATRSRLDALLLIARAVAPIQGAGALPGLDLPLVLAATEPRTPDAVIASIGPARRAVRGGLVLLCHVDDAMQFIGRLGSIDAIRLLWHPADRVDESLAGLVECIHDLDLRARVPPHAVYLSSQGRPTSADDWHRVTTCPVLDDLRYGHRVRQRRVHRSLAALYTPQAPRPRVGTVARAAAG